MEEIDSLSFNHTVIETCKPHMMITSLSKPYFYCYNPSWFRYRLDKMTQEVGYVDAVKDPLNLEEFPIGCMLFILPWHVSTTEYPVVNNLLAYKCIFLCFV